MFLSLKAPLRQRVAWLPSTTFSLSVSCFLTPSCSVFLSHLLSNPPLLKTSPLAPLFFFSISLAENLSSYTSVFLLNLFLQTSHLATETPFLLYLNTSFSLKMAFLYFSALSHLFPMSKPFGNLASPLFPLSLSNIPTIFQCSNPLKNPA